MKILTDEQFTALMADRVELEERGGTSKFQIPEDPKDLERINVKAGESSSVVFRIARKDLLIGTPNTLSCVQENFESDTIDYLFEFALQEYAPEPIPLEDIPPISTTLTKPEEVAEEMGYPEGWDFRNVKVWENLEEGIEQFDFGPIPVSFEDYFNKEEKNGR